MRAILALFYYIVVFTIMVVAGIPYTLYCGIRGHWEDCTKICSFSFQKIIFKLFGIKVSVKGAENIPQGIIKRPQIRIHLLGQIPGQKAQPLPAVCEGLRRGFYQPCGKTPAEGV